jgi:hypothetical protein
MPFFSQFPKLMYDFNRTGTSQQMVNIFRSIRPQSSILSDVTLYKNYRIENGLRPDVISEKLYGTSDYYWTFFIINDFLHDGLQAWPLSENGMRDHMRKNYSGIALQFTPTTLTNESLAGVAATKNSIAGKLELGAFVYGLRSGAIGRIIRKDLDLNLIVLDDVVPGVEGRNPQTGALDNNIEGGEFKTNEFLQSQWTDLEGVTRTLAAGGDILNTLKPDKIFNYADAPAFYYLENDPEERPVTSPDILPTQASQTTPVYSELQWNLDLQSKISNFDLDQLNQNALGDQNFIATNTAVNAPLISNGGYQPVAEDISSNIVYKSNRDFVRDKNDARSTILVISPQYINEFVEEFERVLNV